MNVNPCKCPTKTRMTSFPPPSPGDCNFLSKLGTCIQQGLARDISLTDLLVVRVFVALLLSWCLLSGPRCLKRVAPSLLLGLLHAGTMQGPGAPALRKPPAGLRTGTGSSARALGACGNTGAEGPAELRTLGDDVPSACRCILCARDSALLEGFAGLLSLSDAPRSFWSSLFANEWSQIRS